MVRSPVQMPTRIVPRATALLCRALDTYDMSPAWDALADMVLHATNPSEPWQPEPYALVFHDFAGQLLRLDRYERSARRRLRTVRSISVLSSCGGTVKRSNTTAADAGRVH